MRAKIIILVLAVSLFSPACALFKPPATKAGDPTAVSSNPDQPLWAAEAQAARNRAEQDKFHKDLGKLDGAK